MNYFRGLLVALGIGGAVATGVYVQTPTPPKQETVLILRGLTHYSQDGFPVAEMAAALRKEGYKVTIGNHTQGNDLTKLPDIVIGHSMGANALLKATNRIGQGPRLIISLDAGRWPLYSHGPTNPKIRCVSLYAPEHPIGGQKVLSRCENYRMKGTVHSVFPQYPKIINAVVRIVNEGRSPAAQPEAAKGKPK